jgi:hypothetical protein
MLHQIKVLRLRMTSTAAYQIFLSPTCEMKGVESAERVLSQILVSSGELLLLVLVLLFRVEALMLVLTYGSIVIEIPHSRERRRCLPLDAVNGG